ncbi:MAG: MOSC domain-containing protein [Robiginitalea sp.]|jgi:MOSC domain-containing protein YiiM
MKIISTNTAQPSSIQWQGEVRTTGIYKTPQTEGIYLSPEGVRDDIVGNPKVHGGAMKAAYLFSQDQYPYWQAAYPHLEWNYGMFGENLTVEGLDETSLKMGNIYKIGQAKVRITTPREPCFKLGIRFSDQEIIQKFVAHGYPGSYVEVLESGWVRPGDSMELIYTAESGISIAEFFNLWYARVKDQGLLKEAMLIPWLSEEKRNRLMQWIK